MTVYLSEHTEELLRAGKEKKQGNVRVGATAQKLQVLKFIFKNLTFTVEVCERKESTFRAFYTGSEC